LNEFRDSNKIKNKKDHFGSLPFFQRHIMNVCIEDKRYTGAASLRGDRRRIVALQQKLLQMRGTNNVGTETPPLMSKTLQLYLNGIETRLPEHRVRVVDSSESSTSLDDMPEQFVSSDFSLCERNTFDYCNGVQIPTLGALARPGRVASLGAPRSARPSSLSAWRESTSCASWPRRVRLRRAHLESLLNQLRTHEPVVRVLRARLRHERALALERQLASACRFATRGPMLDMLLAAEDYAAALDLGRYGAACDRRRAGRRAGAARHARSPAAQAAQTIDKRMRQQFLDELCFGDARRAPPSGMPPMLLVLARAGRLDAGAARVWRTGADARAVATSTRSTVGARRLARRRSVRRRAARKRSRCSRRRSTARRACYDVVLRGVHRRTPPTAALVRHRRAGERASLVARALACARRAAPPRAAGDVCAHARPSASVCRTVCAGVARAHRALQTQARAFVDAFHASRRASLQLLLESELWASWRCRRRRGRAPTRRACTSASARSCAPTPC
jgi:hypothetical protein